ncbi:MAG: transposase [Candidatus Omnitrophica bacterium]|jgi:putative transposase|nr:transposase [Candidatus Omnitrophota bacterium]
MPNGPRILIKNACYHIYSRGNQKQKVFQDDADYLTYLKRLKRYTRKCGFLLFGYCLMPNHIHLIGQPVNIRNLSKLMHCLHLSYTSYYNRRYNKVGHLWQDRFRSKVILKDQYLVDCINYIELNPVRAKIVNSPLDYTWSSYRERVLGETKIKLLDPIQF